MGDSRLIAANCSRLPLGVAHGLACRGHDDAGRLGRRFFAKPGPGYPQSPFLSLGAVPVHLAALSVGRQAPLRAFARHFSGALAQAAVPFVSGCPALYRALHVSFPSLRAPHKFFSPSKTRSDFSGTAYTRCLAAGRRHLAGIFNSCSPGLAERPLWRPHFLATIPSLKPTTHALFLPANERDQALPRQRV